MDFWLDPSGAKDAAFISHAHADHVARHKKIICSSVTGKLLTARFKIPENNLQTGELGTVIEREGFRMRMLSAGHIVGSTMLHVTRIRDGATLLYTGDFKVRRGRTTQQVNFIQADTLIMETTFGLPHLVFPGPLEVDASLMRFINNAFADGETPVLFAYPLGKAQEVLALLDEYEIPVLSHPKIAEMTAACREVGVNLPEPLIFEGFARDNHVVILPPSAVKGGLLRGIKNKRTAMLSGWALQQSARYQYRTDEVIPMSDHADYPGLMECVTRVRPKRVLTVHGFAREFAADLREKGIDAWCAMGGDQLELSLIKTAPRATFLGGPRHSRPICEFADFSDICRLLRETNSRSSKIEHLVNYLRGLDEDCLKLATRWLTSDPLLISNQKNVIRISDAEIKRSLLGLPGVKEERFCEIFLTQNDMAKTARLFSQEAQLYPKPFKINIIHSIISEICNERKPIARVDLLSKRLFDIHPVETETLIKLLKGEISIEIKDGLVEEAIARLFGLELADIMKASMITADLGLTATLAKNGQLDSLSLEPLTPVLCMLPASVERDESEDSPPTDGIEFEPPLWVEPKHNGIRVQLHKMGDTVAVFSRDLRRLDQNFPELIESAKFLKGDFVLDGELIVSNESQQLIGSDLLARIERKHVERDLFLEPSQVASDCSFKYIAFDLLWLDGEDLLDQPLSYRREKLESLNLYDNFSVTELIRLEQVENLPEAYRKSIQKGFEGLIVKDPQSKYSMGKLGKSWLKLT